MEQLNWNNLRTSVLWVLAIVALLAYASLAAQETPENLSNLSLVLDRDLTTTSLVMMLFVFLSLILKGPTNRLVNIIAGAVLGILALIVLIDGLNVHLAGVYNLMMGAMVLILLATAWLAYRMPKTQT